MLGAFAGLSTLPATDRPQTKRRGEDLPAPPLITPPVELPRLLGPIISPPVITPIRNYFARRRIKGLFGAYVSTETVQAMVESGEDPQLGGAEVELTPFFASVHSYVGLAEQVSLVQLREIMNAYFDVVTAEITREGGTLDKYIGDAVVAMFGAPIKRPDHALRATVTALRCQTGIAALRDRFRREGDQWPEHARQLRVRTGLHTGVALVGNMGSRTRFNHTMMGDNVNLAARLESGAKNYGVWTLCTEATQRACEQAAPGRIVFRSLGRIIVKGRRNPVQLFEPVALREDASDRLRDCVATFEAGLGRFRERDYDGAIELLKKSARLEADQPGAAPEIRANPSTVFLAMAQSLKANPGADPLVI